MRTHNSNFYLHPLSNDNPGCPSSNIENDRCKYTQRRFPLSDGGVYSFTFSDFDRCECTGSNFGGAISCTSGSLAIEDCTFTNCKSSQRAGAVYFRSTFVCKDINNIFKYCSCTLHIGCFDDWYATSSMHHLSKYINSEAGGACGVLNIEASTDNTISSCLFVKGTANDRVGLFGFTKIGGRAITSNCLFAEGTAGTYGGAFATFPPFTGIPRPYFSFCFFCNNVCLNPNRGADFDATEDTQSSFSKEQIIHCFSSSRGLRIYISGMSTADTVNWLPHATFLFIHGCCGNITNHTTVAQRKSEIIIDESFSQFSEAFSVVVKFTIQDSLSYLPILLS